MTKKTRKDRSFLFEWSIRILPLKQPTREGQIQTANQKRGSIQKARKSPDLERISAPDKEHSRGKIKIANQNGLRGANTVVFAAFIKIRGFSHGL